MGLARAHPNKCGGGARPRLRLQQVRSVRKARNSTCISAKMNVSSTSNVGVASTGVATYEQCRCSYVRAM